MFSNTEILSGIVGAILTLFISPIFVRKNNEQNSLHSESVWRQELFDLSKTQSISGEQLALFRSFLSATRGMQEHDIKPPLIGYWIDTRVNGRDQNLDDTCLHYYYYLVQQFNSQRTNHITNDIDVAIFRQLCRLLLKSDWNNRIQEANILNILNCVERYEEMELKARIITKTRIDNNVYSDDKYSEYVKRLDNISDKGNKNIKKINCTKIFLLFIPLIVTLMYLLSFCTITNQDNFCDFIKSMTNKFSIMFLKFDFTSVNHPVSMFIITFIFVLFFLTFVLFCFDKSLIYIIKFISSSHLIIYFITGVFGFLTIIKIQKSITIVIIFILFTLFATIIINKMLDKIFNQH
ncbi:hypothetical protein [Apilactobacillus xinyiensis]|uniref:hypothetical protein n=1 Tax=Apilactobacillus xinyiensis TaxID=2841032 RepID=UPI00200E5547|nr:hypothetical protein [Apilactobacillus xinyiensis]MCL0330834.1 hypothetical protein [Apilactobacillus xinyiensis]